MTSKKSLSRYPLSYLRTTPYEKNVSMPSKSIYVRPNGEKLQADFCNLQVEKGDHSSSQQRAVKDYHEQQAKVFLEIGIDIKNARKIGCGHYSRVFKAKLLKKDGSKVPIALKVINEEKQSAEYLKKFLPREIECWKKLDHPLLIKLYGHYTGSKHTILTMEYTEHGDLLKYVQNNGAMPEHKAKLYSHQIIEAVGFMHASGVCHRDIKLENIMIFSDQLVKLGDFGFSKFTVDQNGCYFSRTHCGSKSYSAPEILCGMTYDPLKSDIWAVGIVIFIMSTNHMPFKEDQHNMKIVEIQRTHSFNYSKNNPISIECRQVIVRMLQYFPHDRPQKIKDILSYQWFR